MLYLMLYYTAAPAVPTTELAKPNGEGASHIIDISDIDDVSMHTCTGANHCSHSHDGHTSLNTVI